MRTLSPRHFTDPNVMAREREAVFANSWQPFIPSTIHGDGGGRLPGMVGIEPVILDHTASVALSNVCTHAWHTLVTTPSTGRLVCPQHGRQFDESGRAISQRGFRPDEFTDDDNLHQFNTLNFGPTTWLSAGDPNTPSWLKLVQQSVGNSGLEELAQHPISKSTRIVEGNWKLHAANYLDSMHIPYIHGSGGLASKVKIDSYQTEIYHDAVLQWAYAKDKTLGFEEQQLDARFYENGRPFALWWFIFPNITLNFYPWGLSLNVYAPHASDPQKTAFHWLTWAWHDAAIDTSPWLMESVDEEDVEAIAQVQRGVNSQFAKASKFAPGMEDGPAWFHARLAKLLADGDVDG